MDPLTELTEQEATLVKQFRHRVADLLPQMRNEFYRNDLFLVRFIRARDLDLERAEEMMRKHMEWRKEKQIDQVLRYKIDPSIEQNFPVFVCGYGKDGYPVLLFNFGRWNIRDAVENGLKDDIVTYAVKFFEVILEFCRKITTPDKYYSKVHVIIDLEGFGFYQLASRQVIDFICQVISIFENNYPEILQSAWVINAPTIFQILWTIVKPLLTPRTISKIKIVGNNRDKWRPDLFEMISPDNLPAQNGGALTTCTKYKFEYGLDVFDKYDANPKAERTSVVVPAGKVHEIPVEVKDGTMLHWAFKTDHYDIGFKVIADNDDHTEVEYCRCDAYLFDLKGKLNPKPGKYKLVFDNSYSTFTNKTVHYTVWTN